MSNGARLPCFPPLTHTNVVARDPDLELGMIPRSLAEGQPIGESGRGPCDCFSLCRMDHAAVCFTGPGNTMLVCGLVKFVPAR